MMRTLRSFEPDIIKEKYKLLAPLVPGIVSTFICYPYAPFKG